MLRLTIFAFILLILACSDSTGPSFSQYSRVSVVNTSTGSIVANIELDPTFHRDIIISPDGRYTYINSSEGDNIIQIDCLSNSISGGLDLGGHNYYLGLCMNSLGTELYTTFEGELFIIDSPSLAITDTVQLNCTMTLDMAYRSGTDLVYILFLRTSGPGTLVVDVEQGEVVDTLSHAAFSPVFSENGNELYISDSSNQLICIDPDTDKEIASADIGNYITDICVVPASDNIYVSWKNFPAEGGVLALDRNTLEVTNSIGMSFEADNLCYVPVLNLLYAGISSGRYDNRIMVVDLPGFVPSDEIKISNWLVNMASAPSGDFVYCNIFMDDSTDR
ncbi:MAG: hypothetical protein K8S15_06900 [Candidatus Aegiribacteria sp.]|nr:hypothetical protein [Candidatus Aegiribacteria sp.]